MQSTRSIFGLQELVLRIDAYLEPRHSVSLACSNLSMFNTIMPRLWKHVNGMTQLFSLLPDGKTLNQEGNPIPIGDPTGPDFSRFETYSGWVEHLTLTFETLPMGIYDRTLLAPQEDMLYYYASTRVLLPNLRSITSTSTLQIIAVPLSCLMAFLSPSLVSLNLVAENYVETMFPPLPALLYTLSTRCPKLNSLAMIPRLERRKRRGTPFSLLFKYATNDYKTQVEDEIKKGLGPSLARINPLTSFTTSAETLDHSCYKSISAWPLLERLEIVMNLGRGYQLPELAESAFPCLKHLTLHKVPNCNAFKMFWDAATLVGKLTSVQLDSSTKIFSNLQAIFHENDTLLSYLARRSPHIQHLFLRFSPQVIGQSTDISMSAFDVLHQLPLRSLHIEGVHLTQRDNIPEHLVAIFPNLEYLGLPSHSVAFADLQAFQACMPQLHSLCIGAKIESVSQDLDVKLETIERYRQSVFHTLQIDLFQPGNPIIIAEPGTSPYTYQEIMLLIR
ncbi:hypothetical protein FRC12_024046 [Ceratobasidium sp. 428]|nr:hypothetical protein FRC12_024046 [Ceratobasidium sp. 428]